MSDRARRDEVDSVDERECAADIGTAPTADDGAKTDAYEVENGVVIYDIENPLAWVETDAALDVEQMV